MGDRQPVEPPATAWQLPDPSTAPADQELVGIGADLAPATLLAAYRRGLFPMHVDLPDGSSPLGWWSPNPRGVLYPHRVHASRSLWRSMKAFTITFDQAFAEVVSGCADPRRPNGWIEPDFVVAYQQMYELGWAHSVEVWSRRGDGLVLVGGLFGLQIGGLFAAESKFHRVRDASKAAVVALCRHLSGLPGGESRLVDTQWQTPHLGTLGVCEVDRRDYLAALPRIVGLPPSW